MKASTKTKRRKYCLVWKPINGKWFLDSEDIMLKMGDQSFDTSKKDSIKPGEKPKYNKRNSEIICTLRTASLILISMESKKRQNLKDILWK